LKPGRGTVRLTRIIRLIRSIRFVELTKLTKLIKFIKPRGITGSRNLIKPRNVAFATIAKLFKLLSLKFTGLTSAAPAAVVKLMLLPALLLSTLLSCPGCAPQTIKPGDTIVPPVAGNQQEEDFSSPGSHNYLMNISPLMQPSTNMVYTMIDKSRTPVSVAAENKYLYLLCPGEDPGEKTGDETSDKSGNNASNKTSNKASNETSNTSNNSNEAGDKTGNAAGSMAGNITEDMAGNMAGNITKDMAGYTAGDVEGNMEGDMAGGKTGYGMAGKDAMLHRHGNVIYVHDAENGSLAGKISSERLKECTALTVKESNIYVFDMKTGKVSLFSSGGKFLAEYDMGMPGVYANKIAVTDSQHIILLASANAGENSKIMVYSVETGDLKEYDAGYLACSDDYDSRAESHGEQKKDEPNALYNPGQEHKHEIVVFCPFGEKSILVALSCGRLSLFNIEKEAVEKSCVFPMTAGFMVYDGNVLYYTSSDLLYISLVNAANFTNIRSSMHIGRILINSNFDWPQTEQELGQWLLNNIRFQVPDESGWHYGMAQNAKYLFFLDFIPATLRDNKAVQNEPGFVAYRVMK